MTPSTGLTPSIVFHRAFPLLSSTLPAQPIRFLDELIDGFPTEPMLRDTAE